MPHGNTEDLSHRSGWAILHILVEDLIRGVLVRFEDGTSAEFAAMPTSSVGCCEHAMHATVGSVPAE